MELRLYLKIIKKHLLILIAFTIAGSAIAALTAARLPQTHQESQLLFLAAPTESRENSSYFQQERARNFTDTAVVILESPDFTREIAPNITISARKLAPQIIRLTVAARNPKDAQYQLAKIISRFNRKMSALAGDSLPIEIKPLGPSPHPQLIKYSPTIITAAGAIVGLIFAIITIALKVYFKI